MKHAYSLIQMIAYTQHVSYSHDKIAKRKFDFDHRNNKLFKREKPN